MSAANPTRVGPKRIGVLGAGQLALMLAEAAPALGLEVVCAGQPGDCAAQVAPVFTVDLDDAEQVRAFAARCDRVTLESENIAAAVLQGLALAPNAKAVEIAQDRLLEKRFFQQCGLGTAPFVAVESLAELRAAMQQLGLPAILKTRRMGYDGKGQARLQQAADAEPAWAEIAGAGSLPCILEGMVRFDYEVSLLAARAENGQVVFYPLVHNTHREGILRRSVAPLEASLNGSQELQAQAEQYVGRLLQELQYVGLLAVEFFVLGGQLLANEMAPRVHNSGHWTIEGAATSQFANHLRAIAGLPLGSTASQPTVMLNCIGQMPPLELTAAWPGVQRHDYGKQPRPGRKVGHLTVAAEDRAAIEYWQPRLA